MNGLLERIGVERPVVQAGLGGGLAGAELAAAVSGAGGLGTVGFAEPERMRAEISRARARSDRPVAANLLLPFARRAHWHAVEAADVVATFWGRPRRRTAKPWLHQVGSEEEARAAAAAGADAVIAQGVESGGHVRGTTPALELLMRVRAAVGDRCAVLLAGGVADGDDVRSALEAGADAAVLGTRFLMSRESNAAPEYKRRLVEARETLLTQLFGMGWPAPHRVLPNRATARWLDRDGREPRWLRALQRGSAPVLSRLPLRAQARLASSQQADRPLFGPLAPAAGGSPNLVDAGALYAGASVARIHDVRPAGELVAELSGAA